MITDKQLKKRFLKIAALIILCILTSRLLPEIAQPEEKGTWDDSSVVQSDQDQDQDTGLVDPYEPFNRAMYQFNEVLDIVILKPLAMIYNAVLPRPINKG